MEIRAKVIEHLELQQGVSKSGNDWKKAILIVETIEQYPKKVALQNMRKAEEFNALPIGTTGTFSIDVESREYNGRWYSEITCWAWNPDPAYQYQQP